MNIESLHELYEDQIRDTGDVIEYHEIFINPDSEPMCLETEQNLVAVIQQIEQHPLHSLETQKSYVQSKLEEYTFRVIPPCCAACKYNSVTVTRILIMTCRACQYIPVEISDFFCNMGDNLEDILDTIQRKLDTEDQESFLRMARKTIEELKVSENGKHRIMLSVLHYLARIFPGYLLTNEAAEIQSEILEITSEHENNSSLDFCILGREKDYKIGGFTCPNAPQPSEIEEILVYDKGNIKACQKILKDIEDLKN